MLSTVSVYLLDRYFLSRIGIELSKGVYFSIDFRNSSQKCANEVFRGIRAGAKGLLVSIELFRAQRVREEVRSR